MRLLVLDGSRALTAVVSRLAPAGVEVESASTFAEASRRLRRHPPEALMVDIGPTPLPWKELKQLCESHQPPIPVLYESSIYHDADEAGIGQLSPCAHFLEKPYSIDQLRSEVEWLLHAAEELGRQAQASEADAEGPVS